MSWQRHTSRALDALVSLTALALVLLARPAPPSAARPARWAGTKVAVLAAEEERFGVWRGRDLARGGKLSHGARLFVALEPNVRSRVQLFVRKERMDGSTRVREVRLVKRGGLWLAPAPGQSLVFVGGVGELLLRVCPGETPRISPSSVAGQRALHAALDGPAPRALRLAREARGAAEGLWSGWQTRLPDGAPVELSWHELSGRGCQWGRVPLGEALPVDAPGPVAAGRASGTSGGAQGGGA